MGGTRDLLTRYRRFVVWEAAAVLRHDVRNKLAAVRNATFYLQRKVAKEAPELGARDPRIPAFFELIGTELDGADAIISDRLPKLDPEPAVGPIDLWRVADEAVAALDAASGVELTLPAAGAPALACAPELAIAIFCLVENALEAAAGRVAIACRIDGGRAVLEVCDDGPGLPAAPRTVLAHFFTTRPGRLGLGLPIALRLIERSRGTLELGDRDGRGVRATVALPAGEAS